MPKILVVNGPNLNLLGKREPDIYGTLTLDELNENLNKVASELHFDLQFFQSNSEGSIIDFIHGYGFEADGMIINPGAYTHYSYAIRDAIAGVGIKTVEVHLSNIQEREEFRKISVIAPVCINSVIGYGARSYEMALAYFSDNRQKD